MLKEERAVEGRKGCCRRERWDIEGTKEYSRKYPF